MSVIALAWTGEGLGRYALGGVGTLQVEGAWDGAIASAGGATWRFERPAVRFGRNVAVATDVAGVLVGEFRRRGGALRWASRELNLDRASSWRSMFSGGVRYVLKDGERIVAELRDTSRRRRPMSAEVPVVFELKDVRVVDQPGLLLFVAFLVGWLADRDMNGDGE